MKIASTIDALGYATTYGYDALGRQTSVTDPLTNTVYTAYDAEGHVIAQRGATYPVDYSYNEFGDKVSMTTYRDLVGRGDPTAPQGDTTLWLRDEATGLVTNKVYADGKGPRYDYTPDGKLATRTRARGIVTTYSYDDNGSLTNTVYSDGTPTISLFNNRAGRQIEAHDAAGVTTFAYDEFGSLTNETVVGIAGTNTIERFYDTFGRNAGYALNGVRQSTLAYDPATGRLATMLANGSDTPFIWNYLPGSDLKSSLSYPNGLTASWQYDANNQLFQVCNATPTNIISQYDYTYDPAGRRIARDHSGSAFDHGDHINYDYNIRSELTNALATVDSSYSYSYMYDDIGNRIWSLENTNYVEYAANNLNQYTQISYLCGSASLREEFTPQFDDDGNQTLIKTSTGTWSVIYNGENRPIYWSNGITNIVMSFDRMGRRLQYLECYGTATNDNKIFRYYGYLQVANLEITTHNAQHFIWDPAEPIATRPLMFCESMNSQRYYMHDGNKNVSDVVSSANNSVCNYKYSVYGTTSSFYDSRASKNPWCFSSEYFDEKLDLMNYNYRTYSSADGRWASRDRMFEDDSVEYVYSVNSPANYVDRLGMSWFALPVPPDGGWNAPPNLNHRSLPPPCTGLQDTLSLYAILSEKCPNQAKITGWGDCCCPDECYKQAELIALAVRNAVMEASNHVVTGGWVGNFFALVSGHNYGLGCVDWQRLVYNAISEALSESPSKCFRPYGVGRYALFGTVPIHNWVNILGPDAEYTLLPYVDRCGVPIDPWPSGGDSLFPEERPKAGGFTL